MAEKTLENKELAQFKDIEEFKKGSNNFMFSCFTKKGMGGGNRSSPCFKRFSKLYPSLEKELTATGEKLPNEGVRIYHHEMQPEEQRKKIPYEKFFKAYQLMSKCSYTKECKKCDSNGNDSGNFKDDPYCLVR